MSAKFSGLVLKTLPQAAATTVYAAISPDLLNQSGMLLPLLLLPCCACNPVLFAPAPPPPPLAQCETLQSEHSYHVKTRYPWLG